MVAHHLTTALLAHQTRQTTLETPGEPTSTRSCPAQQLRATRSIYQPTKGSRDPLFLRYPPLFAEMDFFCADTIIGSAGWDGAFSLQCLHRERFCFIAALLLGQENCLAAFDCIPDTPWCATSSTSSTRPCRVSGISIFCALNETPSIAQRLSRSGQQQFSLRATQLFCLERCFDPVAQGDVLLVEYGNLFYLALAYRGDIIYLLHCMC